MVLNIKSFIQPTSLQTDDNTTELILRINNPPQKTYPGGPVGPS
jgi:hypothetical protein